jgi:hypothetical protein
MKRPARGRRVEPRRDGDMHMMSKPFSAGVASGIPGRAPAHHRGGFQATSRGWAIVYEPRGAGELHNTVRRASCRLAHPHREHDTRRCAGVRRVVMQFRARARRTSEADVADLGTVDDIAQYIRSGRRAPREGVEHGVEVGGVIARVMSTLWRRHMERPRGPSTRMPMPVAASSGLLGSSDQSYVYLSARTCHLFAA